MGRAVRAVMGTPIWRSLLRVPGCTGLPSSSSLVPADAASMRPLSPALRTFSRMTNSAMGERQMLPRQTNRILVMDRSSFERNML